MEAAWTHTMQTAWIHEALGHALSRWESDHQAGDVEASLRHIEVFALAAIARELREISRTLQARHEEAIDRGTTDPPGPGNGPETAAQEASEGSRAEQHGGGVMEVTGEAEAEAPRRRDAPCRATKPADDATAGALASIGAPIAVGKGPLRMRCTRPQGHAGEHVDALGERWGGEG